MGCVFGREISSSGQPSSEIVVEKKRERDRHTDSNVHSARRERASTENADTTINGGETQNEASQKGEKDGNVRPRGERRRSKPNPRLSNPPKNIHGEQVAAGWPAWLSAVAGEAINGWIPRRADTFEKIDKASTHSCFSISMLLTINSNL